MRTLPVRLAPAAGIPPDRAARELRRMFGLGPLQPVPYLLLAAERLGVVVLALPVGVRCLDAFCAWSSGLPTVFALGDVPGDRLRFSIAHELGHLLLHDARTLPEVAEAEANAFAAELLAPADAMRLVLPARPTLGALVALKADWGMSVRALLRRTREVGVVDDARYASLQRQLSARGWTRVEPGYVPVEKPRAFRKMVEIAYGGSVRAFARAAGWSDHLARRVVEVHASAAELPFDRGATAPLPDNVLELTPR